MIWNKEELKNIKKIILQRASIKVDDNGEFSFTPKPKNVYLNQTGYTNLEEYVIEIADLLRIESKDKIIEALNVVKTIKADPTDPTYYGFVLNVSKVNPIKHEEIFTIFKELIGQYEKTTSKIARLVIENITDIEDLIEHSKTFTNATETTNEELLVKADLEKTFALANNINKCEIFKPLITKLDNSIKQRLTTKINYLVNQEARKHYKPNELIGQSYQAETSKRINKKLK